MTDAQRASLSGILEGTAERLTGWLEQALEGAKRELADSLNHSIRALRAAPDAATWKETLMDGVAAFSRRSVLLRQEAAWLRAESSRGWEFTGAIPAAEAPAIRQAIETQETLVAARAASEVSAALADFGGSEAGRLYVFPLPAAVPAAIVAETPTQLGAIEALTVAAAMALERIRQRTQRPEIAPALATAPPPAVAESEKRRPAWESLPRAEREQHLKAQRFARMRVAEWQLREAAAVAAGVRSGRLYATLQPFIDAARDQYRSQFLDQPAMVDYLHVEIVRTLLADREELLGEDYPGPLV